MFFTTELLSKKNFKIALHDFEAESKPGVLKMFL